MWVLERTRKVQQMARVVGPRDARRQRGVIACDLAFQTQSVTRNPEQRIEPVDHAERLRGHLHNPVDTTDVCQLVAQHDRGTRFGPCGGARR